MGAVLIGGLIEGCLGLLARYWKKIITPIVAASVVTSIGFSLFSVGTRSFGGGYSESFGSAKEPEISSSVTSRFNPEFTRVEYHQSFQQLKLRK